MMYKETFIQSQNISKRSIIPTGIVIHHSGGSYKGSVAWCLDPESKVSYHCMINTDGTRTVMAKDNQRAWHAGVSSWKGKKNCNDFMLGIAVSGDTNKRDLTSFEIDSVAQWCVKKMKLHSISLSDVVTHEMIAPNRKVDVSEKAHDQIVSRIKEILNILC